MDHVTKYVILEVQNEYECKIHSLVTNNAENMNKFRILVTNDSPDNVAYGCGAHLLNLLAKGLYLTDIIKKVIQVAKHFRNCVIFTYHMRN